MKKYGKKYLLWLLLSFFANLQALPNADFFQKSTFLTGYFFGTFVGVSAILGTTIIPPIVATVNYFKEQWLSQQQISYVDNNNILDGYIGAIPQEVADLLAQLKNAEEYEKMGVKLTKGFIFYGPPGSGKTHLARSLAAQVGCPFIPINASDFKQDTVGSGKDAVKELFSRARDAAWAHNSKTAIIFIDEFDSVGMRVGGKFDGGRSEVINALLNEMDGFDQHEGIRLVVIAATNFLDGIDSALKRSGRLDHKIYVPYPDIKGRTLFIKTFLQKHPSNPTISTDELVQATKDMSPADLVLLFELAGRIAVRSKKETRDMSCFRQALKQIKNK